MPRIKFQYTTVFFFCLTCIYSGFCRADFVQDQTNSTQAGSNQSDAVSQEFSNLRPDTDKEFSNQPIASPSARDLIQEIFNSDLTVSEINPKLTSNMRIRVNAFDLGTEVFYYRYEEPSLGVKIDGPMYGFFANYAYHSLTDSILNNFFTNYYALQARYATSDNLDYKGSGTINGKHDFFTEFRGLLGKDYFIGTDAVVTPYFGFGYRYLFDRGNGILSSTNLPDYDRKSHYYYLPVGGNAAIQVSNNWEVDLNAEYDVFLQGWQKSYLSDGNRFNGQDYPNVTNHQNGGYGIRTSIKFLRRGRLVDFYIEPYFRYWNINQSKTNNTPVSGGVLSGYEPENTTVEAGSEFGIQF